MTAMRRHAKGRSGMGRVTGAARQGGFTLVESIVTLFVLAIVLVAVLSLFDFSNKLTRVQMQISDMQQELRVGQYEVARLTRMAGRGGLPASTPAHALPNGVALGVRDNVGSKPTDDVHVAIGDPASPQIITGTDVLTVRGIFNTPVYQIQYADAAQWQMVEKDTPLTFTTDPTKAKFIRLQVCRISPAGIEQDLGPLQKAIADNTHEAIVMVSPIEDSIYAVVELDPARSTTTSLNCPLVPPPGSNTREGLTLWFNVGTTQVTPSSLKDYYSALSPAPVDGLLMPAFTKAAFIGIIEEYRYYLRLEYERPGDASTPTSPRLTRARFAPGTELAYAADGNNFRLDVAENLIDFQVALAVDLNADGAITDDGTKNDEWLFNAVDDDPTDARWANQRFFNLRFTTMARTDRYDPKYSAPAIDTIEDNVYAANAYENAEQSRMHRRRLAQTVIQLRNL